MVSYFVPRGRFLIKAGNLRHAYQKHQQQQQQPGRWPMLRQFRKTFSTKSNAEEPKVEVKADASLIRPHSTPHRVLHHGKKTTHCQKVEKQRPSIWTTWTGFLLRWAPMGICVFGAIEWQWHKQKCERDQLPRTASNFQTSVYCSLPLRIISRCWGWLAACYVPISMRPYLYGWYSNAFNVNLEEALHPDYKHYNSLADFFTRPLKDGVRSIDRGAPLVSPADGKILHFGSANNSLIEQVKGVNYSIEGFLGPPTWKKGNQTTTNADDFEEIIKEKHDGSTALYQCVIYLAPGDYHRFHSSAEWQPIVRRHFAGELLSVNPKIATWLPGLFCLNERALYMGRWKYGFFSYTAVGATNVGSVQIYIDDKLKTNRWNGLKVGAHKKYEEFDEVFLNEATKLNKGELLGQFNMGSTIVLLFEAPTSFKFSIEAGQKICVGEALGHIEK